MLKVSRETIIYICLFVSQVPILLAMNRIGYYILLSVSTFIAGYLAIKASQGFLLKVFFSFFLVSTFGLASYLSIMGEYQIKHSFYQVLIIHYSSVLQYFFFAFIFICIYDLVNDEEQLISCLLRVLFIVSASRFVNIYFFNDVQGDDGRYYLGFYLAIFIPLAIFFVFKLRNLESFMVLFFLVAITYYCFSIYLHRSVVVILPLVVFVWGLMNVSVKKAVFLSFAIVISLYCLPFLIGAFDESYLFRLNYLLDFNFTDNSSSERIHRYIEIIELLIRNPYSLLFGYSLGASETLTKFIGSHSALLGFFYDAGLVSVVGFFILIILPILKYPFRTNFTCMLKAYVVSILIFSTFYYAPIFPVSEIKVLDFSVVVSVLLGGLYGLQRKSL